VVNGKADKATKTMTGWKEYERSKAREHRGKHVGGAGKPDYTRGKTRGEVKHRKSPLTKPEVQKAARRGITEIENLGGYTKPALEYAQRNDIKLFHRGRLVA